MDGDDGGCRWDGDGMNLMEMEGVYRDFDIEGHEGGWGEMEVDGGRFAN